MPTLAPAQPGKGSHYAAGFTLRQQRLIQALNLPLWVAKNPLPYAKPSPIQPPILVKQTDGTQLGQKKAAMVSTNTALSSQTKSPVIPKAQPKPNNLEPYTTSQSTHSISAQAQPKQTKALQEKHIELYHFKPTDDTILLSEINHQQTLPAANTELEVLLTNIGLSIQKALGRSATDKQSISKFQWPITKMTTTKRDLQDALHGLIAGQSASTRTHLIVLGRRLAQLIFQSAPAYKTNENTSAYQLINHHIETPEGGVLPLPDTIQWSLLACSTTDLLTDRQYKATLWKGIKALSLSVNQS